LKTCQKAEARTTTKDILQTNNKNPILHLITRSVKQKIQQKEEEKMEKRTREAGRNKLWKQRLLSH